MLFEFSEPNNNIELRVRFGKPHLLDLRFNDVSFQGLDSDVTGSILGVYYATTVLASPFMAIFMTKIGQANLLQVYDRLMALV